MTMTCRDEVLKGVQELSLLSPSGEFSADDVVAHLRWKGSAYKDSTIRTHVTSRMCVEAPDNHDVTYDDLKRTARRTYRLRQ